MRTREQIYGREAGEIFRCISTYHCIRGDQLRRIFSDKGERLEILLTYLLRQGRIFHDPDGADIFFDKEEMERDTGMLLAIYVLCDFIDRVEFHTVGEYPIMLSFFADGEMYEVIFVQSGKETVINCAAKKAENGGKRLVIVEDISQAEQIDIPDTAAYCLVNRESGEVQYYTVEE